MVDLSPFMKAGKVGVTLFFASSAYADIVTPIATGTSIIAPFTSVASSTVVTPQTETGDGVDNGVGPVSVSDIANNSAGSYNFNHTLLANTSSFGTIGGLQYNFVDSYVINIPTALASTYAFSLNLTSQVALTNLSARLYSYIGGGFSNLTIGSTGDVNGPVYGLWSASNNGGTVDSTSLITSIPTSGEYVLQVIGLEKGTSSGTYNGTLAVTPVPLPAALPLLLTGLSGLSVFWRRRKAAAV